MAEIDSVVKAGNDSKDAGEQAECLVLVATMEQAVDFAMPYKNDKVIF